MADVPDRIMPGPRAPQAMRSNCEGGGAFPASTPSTGSLNAQRMKKMMMMISQMGTPSRKRPRPRNMLLSFSLGSDQKRRKTLAKTVCLSRWLPPTIAAQ